MYNADDICDLLSEEEEIEIGRPANLYSIIKTIEVVEWALTNTYIDNNTQKTYVNELLEQYELAKTAYGSKWKDLDTFCKENGLEECTLAKLRIKNGKIDSNAKPFQFVARLVQDLNDVYNTLETCEGVALVSEITPPFQSVIRQIKKCESVIDTKSSEVKKILTWKAKIDKKQAHETISGNDKEQLKLDLISLAKYLQQD